MKKMSAFVLSAFLLTSIFSSSVHAAEHALSIWLNGKKIQFSESEPILENGVTLVPMRQVLEKLDVQLNWDGATQTVSGAKEGFSLSLQVGSTNATANGKAVTLEVAPKLIRNVTYVPLRFVAETVGYQVGWNQSLRQVTLAPRQARLQDDFYEAVNAKWFESTELPEDKLIVGGLMDNDAEVRKLLSKDFAAMASEGRGKIDDEIGNMVTFYKLAADREKLGKDGAEAIRSDVEKLKSINSLAEFAKNQKDLYYRGFALPVSFDFLSDMKDATKNALYLSSPAPALPDVSYYSPENPQSQTVLDMHKNVIADLLAMAGETKDEANRIASEALEFEKELAKYYPSSAETSDIAILFNPRTIAELKAYSKNMDLEKLIVDVAGKTPQSMSVITVKYFENFDKIVNEENWGIIKSWTYANFVLKSASMLSDEFVDKSTQLKRAMYGQEKTIPTEDTVYNIVNNAFGHVAGNYYAEKYFGTEARKDVTDMVYNMIDIYKAKLRNNDWMSETTKKEAIKKLDAMKVHVGYPDKLDTIYSKLKVDENKSLYENNKRLQEILTKNKFAQVDMKVDRDEWRMTANTANMTYQPLNNTITFPAASLQAPFYDKNQSASQNYGGIGAIIAHEISHAFDPNGAKYDEVGNMVNWWTEADFKKYEEKAQAFIAHYNKVEYLGQKLNGQMTVTENIADIGGLTVALEATKQLPDTNLEEFYKSWAMIWRQKTRPEMEQLLLLIDHHAPNKIRVNAGIANTDEFYSTFGVKEGDAMYIAPEDRVSLW
ncbi:M13-type metalloendopeptidase [Paenibacillus hodogayensis]|uniref:M13-type metalloendopeptidase n=1 Tax=Paenibacillus hodogayensis TaxID=279208 RepID=A0ABV5W5V5_9BACL